ncbi:serine--tRNA ligase [Aliidongia dinghuensis]|uniref:Serine--tRNA ligase n=1 Tax=Aliidongia dinghuensis TaxID=1867774 RepID=A0A8J2YSS3_9PROT|nr:serine--tRNA ligase [Aliidongia dinghuensis]GGF13722.1 serine--tRNA ligase [Aliidongia dinghuensis]
MHDLKAIRDAAADFDRGLARRGLAPHSARILDLDAARRAAQTELQEIQTKRNELSRGIGIAKSKGEPVEAIMAEVAAMKDRMAVLEGDERRLGEELDAILAALPNLPAPEVPDGADEHGNVEVRRWGSPRNFAFAPKQHFELGEALGLMDFSRAAKVAGARFTVLKGALARMERALGAFMLDTHTTEFGYTEVIPPALVNDATVFGTGQLPKFSEDLFRTTDGRWLIPTAEVPLTNLTADEILDEAALPLRWTAFTPCFRSEAGSAGRDTRGMIRQHQFSKVELVSIAHPDHSEAEHERMTSAAETILQKLGLPYRVMLLCAGDMGFTARKTYDLEVWLPGQQAYREISSCSNCGEFQARRMKTRFRPAESKGNRNVHTLNGSGLAVGRTLVAILENYQREDGTVEVPAPLRPYMGGLEKIGL